MTKAGEMDKKMMQKIEKISVNTGIGRLATQPEFNDKALEGVIKDFALITGQKPATRAARKSIAGFKLRAGMIIGLKSTLRGRRMADFLKKIIRVVLPRIRDFRGVDTKNVDASGNLTIGIREMMVFPEINPEVSKINFGLQITVVPQSIKSRGEAIEFYKEIGVPFKH